MRAVSTLVAAIGILVACADAAAVRRTASHTPSSTASSKPTSTSTSKKTGCAAVSASLATQNTTSIVKVSDAMACLESVPLDVKRSSAYVDFIEPYIQFQSTLAYLKNPPLGWTLPGVDVLGGLSEIQDNVNSGKYKSQWEFEVDLYMLVNVFPHDFHFNLPLPLLSVFNFAEHGGSLVSVSKDGLSIPQLYFKRDLDMDYLVGNLDWTPSPLVSVNGVNAVDYINYIAQTTSPFQDPDAIFNQAFTSLAFSYIPQARGGNLFQIGGYLYGFEADSYNYTFANGTVREIGNLAVTQLDFTGIETGQDLFNLVDLPPSEVSTTAAAATSTTATSVSTTAATTTSSTAVTSLTGYPSPVAIHPDGYVSGYFLPNSTIAVLVMQSFADAAESDPNAELLHQATVKKFLAECKTAGMTKLIIDVQANGGGYVFTGFDVFKQLFPTLEPFGANRVRATPEVNYLGTLFSAAGVYNETFNTVYQFQSSLNVNDKPFTSWNQEDPPQEIYGDYFTQELRYNFSDIVTDNVGGLNVTGYLSNANPPPQLFNSDDIVLIYDGTCGSTCAIFAELMKSQGGVRSVAVGGRPQYGPMQGVGGSKGAEVITYSNVVQQVGFVPVAIDILKSKGDTLPTVPDSEFIPDTSDSPLGDTSTLGSGGRINLRNNMHMGDNSFTPLQFIYEAANCKLFYTPTDLYNISGLWERVADVAWNKAKCVQGSSVMSDNTFPPGAYDTVAFGPGAYSTVKQLAQPGLLAQRNETLSNAAVFFLGMNWAIAKE
ncbi:peptidase S41 family protein-like protein [Acephala macrosclerotiorum]|nr:peptidase S41 family protein-like protein [Acephala macrosclerotiorum]